MTGYSVADMAHLDQQQDGPFALAVFCGVRFMADIADILTRKTEDHGEHQLHG